MALSLWSRLRPSRLDPFVASSVSGPYRAYARLRAEDPIHWDRSRAWWVVSRYDDVIQVLKDAETFGAAGVASFESTLLGSDPPAHTSVRRSLERLLVLRTGPDLDTRFRTIARETVEALPTAGAFDVVECLASPPPLRLVLDLLGLPVEMVGEAREWSESMVSAEDGSTAGANDQASLRAAFRAAAARYALQVRTQGAPGTWQVEFLSAFGEAALIDVFMLLVIAGTETTANLVGSCLLILARNPQWLERCRADRAMIPAFVEETLRTESPVQWTRRLTRKPVTLGGQAIPAGATVIALIASANRDERRFDDADRFVMPRRSTAHIAFGFGAHYCMGAALARLEARILLEELLDSCQGTLEVQEATIEWLKAPQIRGMRRCLMRWRP